ncbi:MAG: dihydrofolate reductase family protein [Acidimicrobiales bacterium]
MRIVVINHVTLDGVMQAPGRADEDTRDGFEHGGWAAAAIKSPDPDVGEAMGARMGQSDGLLLGRLTYVELLASWNAQGGPFKDALNNAQKYVASATLTEPLPWPNSTLLGADVITEVGALKARPGRELHILGSG